VPDLPFTGRHSPVKEGSKTVETAEKQGILPIKIKRDPLFKRKNTAGTSFLDDGWNRWVHVISLLLYIVSGHSRSGMTNG
jgi:hypothetical protein